MQCQYRLLRFALDGNRFDTFLLRRDPDRTGICHIILVAAHKCLDCIARHQLDLMPRLPGNGDIWPPPAAHRADLDDFAPFFREPADITMRKYFIRGDTHFNATGLAGAAERILLRCRMCPMRCRR